jgi:hypothetical protein
MVRAYFGREHRGHILVYVKSSFTWHTAVVGVLLTKQIETREVSIMKRFSTLAGLSLLFVMLAACVPVAQEAQGTPTEVSLSGAQEVPPVETLATGSVTSTLSGNTLMVTGRLSGLSSPLLVIAGSPGHIHQAPAGENGEIIFPLEFTSVDSKNVTFRLTTELSPEQLEAYNAGEFYVNIHTETHQGGELRAQLTPDM